MEKGKIYHHAHSRNESGAGPLDQQKPGEITPRDAKQRLQEESAEKAVAPPGAQRAKRLGFCQPPLGVRQPPTP